MRMLRNRFVLALLFLVSSLTVVVVALGSHFTVGVQSDGRNYGRPIRRERLPVLSLQKLAGF